MSFTTVRFDHLSIPEIRSTVIPWAAKNMMGRYVYNWPSPQITCASEEDAMVLVLMFGGKKEGSKIDKMIKNDNDTEI